MGQAETLARQKLDGVRQTLAVFPEQLDGCRLRGRFNTLVRVFAAIPTQQAAEILQRAERPEMKMMAEDIAEGFEGFLHLRTGRVDADQSGGIQGLLVAHQQIHGQTGGQTVGLVIEGHAAAPPFRLEDLQQILTELDELRGQQRRWLGTAFGVRPFFDASEQSYEFGELRIFAEASLPSVGLGRSKSEYLQ